MLPDTRPVRAGEELDWTRLEAWLRDRLPAPAVPEHDRRERHRFVNGQTSDARFARLWDRVTYLARRAKAAL